MTSLPHPHDPLTGLWVFYGVCALAVLIVWIGNFGEPRK